MPYLDHPDASLPADRDLAVWRFETFPSFLSLLDRSALYFASLHRLKDKHEGTISAAGRSRLLAAAEAAGKLEETRGVLRLMEILMQGSACVSSWFLNEFETRAMWGLGEDAKDIAIRTTVGGLIAALEPATSEVYGGLVSYEKPGGEEQYLTRAMPLAFAKRRAFIDERELRLVVMAPHSAPGQYVDINLRSLLQTVYLKPGSAPWVVDVVRRLLSRFAIASAVHPSEIDTPPDRES